MIAAILLTFIAAFLIYKYFVKMPTNFPPGPTPLPIIGHLASIGAHPHVTFEQMSKKYGPIVGVKLGEETTVVVHGAELIKEAFNEPVFTARPPLAGARQFFVGSGDGILGATGHNWVEQRRFTLRHLRDFGFGKSSMEELIMDEVSEFCNWLKKLDGKPVTLQERFQLAVVNSLWKIATGERFDHDDTHLRKILDDLLGSAKEIFGFNSYKSVLVFYFPTIAKMFKDLSGWSRLVESKRPILDMFTQIIKEHKETFQEDTGRDFIDVYLKEISQTKDQKSSFNDKYLNSVMADFFLAGSGTTSVTLSWINVYLLHYPRVQKKLHAELDRVVGRSRPASLSDRKSLVYTEALVLETLRISSILPLSVPHAALEDTIFHGYNIPKGTVIIGNAYENHHDPKVWGEDVEEFRPERFLNEDETSVLRHEAFMPFSVGRRVCIGESLARDTIFLFTANLFLNFEVTVGAGMEKPPLEFKRRLTLDPVSSTVVLKERDL